jgi:hypothetical protein
MKRVEFGDGGCLKIRRYLDSYISNELLVETNHEVLRHIESCAACAAELEIRARLRARLKEAVTAQPVSADLQLRIREQIRRHEPGGWAMNWFRARWLGWGIAVAALAAGISVLMVPSPERLPALADRAGQNAYIQKVSANLAAVLRVGLGDHIHCSIFRRYPRNPPPVEEMEASLGPNFKGLLAIVRTAVPRGYRAVMAHQCSYTGRKFIHLTFEKEGRLLSLVVARREGSESLGGMSPAGLPSGIAIFQSAAGPYRVAGFEAGAFFAYVVSDLRGKDNLQIAAGVAKGVHDSLQQAG